MSADRTAELESENIWLRAEVARLGGEMAGLTSALLNIQDKLRDAENALSEKQAAARQAEDVSANYGLMTLAESAIKGASPL